MRKDVLAKCYGGDVTRKMRKQKHLKRKLLEENKQIKITKEVDYGN